MTDMFTGMPVWWQGPIPDNVSGVMQNNLNAAAASNQALSQQTTANSYNTAAQSQAFMDAARAQNNAAYNQAVQFAMLNSSTGGSKPGGYYGAGSGRSSFSGVPLGGGGGNVFQTGASPFNSYGLPGGGGAGSFSPSPNYIGGRGGSSVFNTGASPFNRYGGGANPGGFSPSPNYTGGSGGGQSFNDLWSGRGAQGLSAANLFNTYAYPQQQKQSQMDFLDRFRGMQSPGGGSGGIGSDAARAPAATYSPYAMGGSSWYPQQQASSGRNDLAALMAAAQDRMRAGQGWTIAQQPPAASQGTLTNRINQGIYDIGNAGTLFGQHGLDIARRSGGGGGTLTPQDLAIPHAYPPAFRGLGDSTVGGGGA